MEWRASKPIQASASSASGWVGTKVRPPSALPGNSVEIGPLESYRSTKACDDTKPRVKATLIFPGYVSRRSSMLTCCASP